MGKGFVEYAKPIDLEEITKEMEQRKASYWDQYEVITKLLPVLKKWDTKKLNRRLAGQAEEVFPNRRIYLEKTVTGMMYLVIENEVSKVRAFLVHRSTDLFNYKKFEEDNAIPYLNSKNESERVGEGIKVLPELVEEYNKLLQAHKDLVKRAAIYKMHYDFDILTRES